MDCSVTNNGTVGEAHVPVEDPVTKGGDVVPNKEDSTEEDPVSTGKDHVPTEGTPVLTEDPVSTEENPVPPAERPVEAKEDSNHAVGDSSADKIEDDNDEVKEGPSSSDIAKTPGLNTEVLPKREGVADDNDVDAKEEEADCVGAHVTEEGMEVEPSDDSDSKKGFVSVSEDGSLSETGSVKAGHSKVDEECDEEQVNNIVSTSPVENVADSNGKNEGVTTNGDGFVRKDMETNSDKCVQSSTTKCDQNKDVEEEVHSQVKASVENTASVIKTVSAQKEDKSKQSDTVKSGDSDKENVSEIPMDLSAPSKPSTSGDVIMLSDEEEAEFEMIPIQELSPEKLCEKNKLVKRLQEELRNEEAKLVLLKKLRQSQIMQHMQENNSQPSTPQQPQQTPQQPQPQQQAHNYNKANRQPPGQTAPPPLVRGGQPMSLSKDRNVPPQLMRGTAHSSHMRSHSTNQGPPPLVMAPRQTTPNVRSSGHASSSSVSTPPNLIQGYRPPQAPQQPEQTPAQRQAAAKLALRKQLEKTLLQIPPPKPPPPEMNFIPSLAGNEFICLVGLEEVVKHITESDSRSKGDGVPEVKYVFNPFVCIQCGTDFTPVWKRDKPGSKSVICECCVTSNQKKALKQEHTNRLKSAFVKALQQEQEIEQRMQSQTSSGSTSAPSPAPTTTPAQATTQHNSLPSLTIPTAMTLTNATYGASPVNLSTGFKPTQEQIRQHQNLIHAHNARLGAAPLGLQAFNPRLAFPFPGATPLSNKAAQDLQRQYLLDMINPARSQQGTVLWKS